MKQLLMMVCASILFWGCSDILTNEHPYGEEFTLDHKKSALVGGETLIQFLGVKEDSRCPVDVECVWAGNAVAQFVIKVSGFPDERFELNTHPSFMQEIEVHGVRIQLIDVYPEPLSTKEIAPEDYSVRILVDR